MLWHSHARPATSAIGRLSAAAENFKLDEGAPHNGSRRTSPVHDASWRSRFSTGNGYGYPVAETEGSVAPWQRWACQNTGADPFLQQVRDGSCIVRPRPSSA